MSGSGHVAGGCAPGKSECLATDERHASAQAHIARCRFVGILGNGEARGWSEGHAWSRASSDERRLDGLLSRQLANVWQHLQ